MKAIFLTFLRPFTIFVLILAVLSYLIQTQFQAIGISVFWPWILLFMYAFTSLLVWQLMKQVGQKLSRFTNALMLTNFGKMLLYILIIFFVAWFWRDQVLSFALTFMVYYFAITFFEIRALLRLKQ